jgi:hypothetical protein
MNLRILALMSLLIAPIAAAEASEDVTQRFSFEEGVDNVQPGCITLDLEFNPCHQIATSMNGLDTPIIDVLILVPASPAAERDLRILRQSTEMWADGLEWMARDMGLDWLADGVEFHISMETMNSGEAEFTTYPIVDPEIVIIASNPVGGIGIGIDPLDFAGQLFGDGIGEGPCTGVANPFDHEVWEALPGFNSHHDGRSGTYVEDCDGAGGNICFSVNAAIDPTPDGTAPSVIDFALYDLVSHETGHCLTLGHVGDGAEGSWSSVPTNDIMAYHADPPGLNKCVSSLNTEAFAVMMSEYLDANGDGNVTPEDKYWANDAIGSFDARPFQIQHVDNHKYAASDRTAMTCPQPDLGLVPLVEVVNFTPDAPMRSHLAITNLVDGQAVPMSDFTVGGFIAGNGTGDVMVSWKTLQSFQADPMNLNETVDMNTTAMTVDGIWTATLPFGDVPVGTQMLVSAVWSGFDVHDSDRTIVIVTENATAPAQPTKDDGIVPVLESEDTPALPIVGVLAAIFVALRRRN